MSPNPCTFFREAFCEGNRVYLREIKTSDVPRLVKWKSDRLVQRMALGPDACITAASQRSDIKQAIKSDAELYFIICLEQSDRPLGYIRINWMDTSHRFAWLRFAMGEERGKGYCKDALQAFIARLLSQGVHRIEAEAYEFNRVSIGLMESLGFKREGLKRQAHYDGERYADVAVLGLLAQDFLSHA